MNEKSVIPWKYGAGSDSHLCGLMFFVLHYDVNKKRKEPCDPVLICFHSPKRLTSIMFLPKAWSKSKTLHFIHPFRIHPALLDFNCPTLTLPSARPKTTWRCWVGGLLARIGPIYPGFGAPTSLGWPPGQHRQVTLEVCWNLLQMDFLSC